MRNLIFFLITFIPIVLSSQVTHFNRDFGTYFGDERFSLHGSTIDRNGDLYIAGYLKYKNNGNITDDYPYFNNSPYQGEFAGGISDCYIAKFNSNGELLWATLFGGEKTDVLTGITTDQNNNVYINGVTNSLTGIATSDAIQTERLGAVDMFIAKFNSNGEIIWSTYYGNVDNMDDHEYDDSYFNTNHFENTSVTPDGSYILHDGTSHLYITLSWEMIRGMETISPHNNYGNNEIIKFTDNGELVWHTSYGINPINYLTGMCFCNSNLYLNGYVLALPNENSTYYGNENSLQQVQGGITDTYLAKFNSDGDFIWGSYYGGISGSEASYGSTLTCDNLGNLFNTINTTTSDIMTTQGAFQEERSPSEGGYYTPLITKFNDDFTNELVPSVEWATFLGKDTDVVGNDNHPLFTTMGDDSSIYISGTTNYLNNIATEGIWEYQPMFSHKKNGFITKFDLNGNKLWGTYYSGDDDSWMVSALPYGKNEHFYLTGLTRSHIGLTTETTLQPEWSVWNSESPSYYKYSIFIAHLSPKTSNLSLETITNNYNIYPNPNIGSFTIQQYNYTEGVTIQISDIQGREILSKELSENKIYNIDLNVDNGIYLVNFMMDNQILTSKKLVINK